MGEGGRGHGQPPSFDEPLKEPLNNCHREERCDDAISYLVDLTNCEIASLRSQ